MSTSVLIGLYALDLATRRRFFMIDRSRIGSELREEFSVLGSTGNVRGRVFSFQDCHYKLCRAGLHCGD